MERSVYDAAGGSAALARLAAAWHHRCLQDPVVSHAFSHPGLHPQHVERLAAYWSEALGGPAGYSAGMGDHSHVLRLHAGNGEHAEMDRRAQQCFAVALDDAGRLFLSAAINDWAPIHERGIDTIIDLDGYIDRGVPTVPNQILYI